MKTKKCSVCHDETTNAVLPGGLRLCDDCAGVMRVANDSHRKYGQTSKKPSLDDYDKLAR